MTTNTGRYTITSPSGRKFVVEPIASRSEKIDGHVFTNGGLDGSSVKNKQLGGSVREEDSIITEDKFTNIVTLPPGVSPNGFVEAILACKTKEEEDVLWNRYK